MKFAFPVQVTSIEAKVNKSFDTLLELRKRSTLDAMKKHIVQNCNGSADKSYYSYTEGGPGEAPLRRPGPPPPTIAFYGEWQYDGPGKEP